MVQKLTLAICFFCYKLFYSIHNTLMFSNRMYYSSIFLFVSSQIYINFFFHQIYRGISLPLHRQKRRINAWRTFPQKCALGLKSNNNIYSIGVIFCPLLVLSGTKKAKAWLGTQPDRCSMNIKRYVCFDVLFYFLFGNFILDLLSISLSVFEIEFDSDLLVLLTRVETEFDIYTYIQDIYYIYILDRQIVELQISAHYSASYFVLYDFKLKNHSNQLDRQPKIA